jgi:ABC-type glycerol-3-phosphate transport system substrate-binding protein
LRFALEHGAHSHAHIQTLTSIEGALLTSLRDGIDLESALTQINRRSEAVPTPVPVAVDPPQPTPATGEVVTIDYFDFSLHPGPPLGGFGGVSPLKTLIDDFQRAHPNISIRPASIIAYIGDSDWYDKLPERYDCFGIFSLHGFPGDVDDYYTLDPLFAADDPALFDDYPPALLDRHRINGSIYGLPFDLNPLLIYYNAEYFAEQGLTPPDDDWTFDDFLALAAAATSDTDDGHIYGFVSNNDSAIHFLLSSRFGLPYDLSTRPGAAHFDHPDTAAAVDWLISLSDAGIIPPPDEGGTRSAFGRLDDHFRLVESGRAAMWLDRASPSETGSTVSAEGLPFEVGVAPMPQGAHLLGGYSVSGFLISRRANDPSACWEWITFLSAQPGAFKGMPARRSLIESGEWEARFGADRAAAIQRTIAWPPDLIYTFDAFDEAALLQGKQPLVAWLQDAIAGVLEGGDTAALLAVAQQKADDYVACRATATADRESIIACARRADPDYKPPN